MYTSSLVAEQPMRWVSLLFGFVRLSIFRFKYHSPENRGHMLTTKIVYFVKLSKYEMDYIIAFLSSRWSKNIYGASNLESGWRSYATRKIAPLLAVLTQVGSSDTRKFRQTSELSVSLKRPAGCLGLSPRRKFRHPEVSAEVRTSGIPNKKPCSDLTFWIPIRTIPNLENKAWRGFQLG